jgi:hypothetical protein
MNAQREEVKYSVSFITKVRTQTSIAELVQVKELELLTADVQGRDRVRERVGLRHGKAIASVTDRQASWRGETNKEERGETPGILASAGTRSQFPSSRPI